ncbi:glycosyltransferase [uncultured Ferrimonas sp.]|uniref:glycosyltransferase n=1 Tax=uncultured Ferrimonas sp. TaxID=432640 RepID=UPI00263265B6|nr:glycosyltransferase [uncultured Ferrimonas sp.]
MKPSMLIFGEDWGRLPSSSQHLALALQKQFRLVWVNSIGLRQPRLTDLRRLLRKGLAQSHSAGEHAPFPVIAPKVWPLAQSRWLQRHNRQQLARQLQPYGDFDYIWCALPSAVDYLSLYPKAEVIYYCGDDFSALAGVQHQPVVECEQRLLARCQHLFCASETLLHKLPHANASVLPHGVELVKFSRPQPRPDDLPEGPILGFYGSLAAWIDFELLHQLAQQLPQCQLVLIGHRGECPDKLLRLANVHLLPFKPHQQLPAYVQHFDVALLPFKRNAQIAACNPLKLREYLAAGVPVISSPFAALSQYRCGIATGEGWQGFVTQIVQTLQTKPHRAGIRRQVAGESWQHRADSLCQRLQLPSCKLQ